MFPRVGGAVGGCRGVSQLLMEDHWVELDAFTGLVTLAPGRLPVSHAHG